MKLADFSLSRFLLFLLPVAIAYLGITLLLAQEYSRQEILKLEFIESHALKSQAEIFEERLVSATRYMGSIKSHLNDHVEIHGGASQLAGSITEILIDGFGLPEVFSHLEYHGPKGEVVTWEYDKLSGLRVTEKTIAGFGKDRVVLDGSLSGLGKNDFRIMLSARTDDPEKSELFRGPEVIIVTPVVVVDGEEGMGGLLFVLSENYLFDWAGLDSHGNFFSLKNDTGIWSRKLVRQGKWDYKAHAEERSVKSELEAPITSGQSGDHGRQRILVREPDKKIHDQVILNLHTDFSPDIVLGDLTMSVTAANFSEKKTAISQALYLAHFSHYLYFSVFIIAACFFLSLYYEKKKVLALQLRETKDQLEEVFNNSLPMCITNMDYEIVFHNEAYERTFPFDLKIAKTLKCYELRPGPTCHTDRCSINMAIIGEKEQSAEIMKKADDGTVSYYLYSAKTLFDDQSRPKGVLQSFQDITPRILAEQELKRAIKKIDFLHGILPICSYCKKVRDDQGYWK